MKWLLCLLVVGVLFHLHRKRMAKFSAGMNALLAAARLLPWLRSAMTQPKCLRHYPSTSVALHGIAS